MVYELFPNIFRILVILPVLFCNHVYDLLFSKGFGWCLDDEPSNHKYEYSTVLPGVIYDLDQQCKMRHGPSSGVCHVQWVLFVCLFSICFEWACQDF